MLTSIEKIKPGSWFSNGSERRMMKLQDILPSGLHTSYVGVFDLTPTTDDLGTGSDGTGTVRPGSFTINAIDDRGIPCSCPYGMEIFYVESKDDLYPNQIGPTIRHITINPEKH